MTTYDPLRPWTEIEACECPAVTSLLLVDMLSDNPLHCGECRREVDPERIALSDAETDAVAHWFRASQALYRLWLDSGEYEAYAKARLLDPNGQVNVRGRQVATALSARLPTQLWYFHDTDDGEPTHCPVCRAPLDTNVRWGTGQCVACRIHM